MTYVRVGYCRILKTLHAFNLKRQCYVDANNIISKRGEQKEKAGLCIEKK